MANVDGNTGAQTVGSVTLIDSSMVNVGTGIITARSANSQPPAGGSLVVENLKLFNVRTAIQGPAGALVGSTTSIPGWIQGNAYTPTGPNRVQGSFTPNSRPSSLLQSDGK
jgi:glucan 1,3-beta-glucosidase